MAMDIVQSWHDQLMAQERARVLDRIAYGTKATSPQILMARRMNSLYYSNPLPDNSSGSKNRPIGAMKDESGRADANQQVAMAQGAHHFPHEGMPRGGMRGGVLRNYQYAKTILSRRGRDTEDINLASQGLPPVPSPLLELNEVESRKLELDTLLQSLSNQIEIGDITSLTIGELKNIPRLMVALAPVFTENDIAQIIRAIDVLLRELEESVDEDTPRGKNAVVLYNYLDTRVRGFLEAIMKIINLSPEEKALAVRQLSKEIFKLSPTKTSFPSVSTKSKPVEITPEGLIKPKKMARITRRIVPEPEPEPEPAVQEGAIVPYEEQPAPRRGFQLTDKQKADLRQAYKDKDNDTLEEFIKDNSNLRSAKNFTSRTVMANRIQKLFNFDVRHK